MVVNHHPTASIRKPRQREGVVLLGLLAITMTAWCVGHGMMTAERWGLPTTYLEPVYSDFIGTCGYLKSMAAGDFLPFCWKTCPDLGAPGTGNWNLGPTPEETLMGWFGMLVRVWGLYPGINLGVLVGHLAAAATFYLVARRGFACGRPWAFVGGLAFGLASYQFAQQPHHLNCQYIWHLPLFPLVWKWLADGADLSIGSRRFWQALAIAFVTGLQNPYYSNIFCQLVLVTGAVRAWQGRSWAPFKPAGLVITAVAAAFFLSNLDTFTYRLSTVAGAAGPLIGQREYRWMDIYGFKLVDLFIPPITHHSTALAEFGLAHRQASVLNDEEGSGYLGLLGIGCLLFLVATAVRAMVEGRSKDVPIEAWWVLWIVIMFTTGGLNAIIAAFTGFTLFRTAIRYSIVVLLVALFYAAGRLTVWHDKAATRLPAETLRIATLTAAIGGTLLVLWDQVPRTPTPQQAGLIAAQVRADRDFVTEMERALPPTEQRKPMVFQLPVMDGTPLPGIPSSDHTRPYLYSRGLHFSAGATDEHASWQQQVQQMLYQGAGLDEAEKKVRFDEANVAKAVEAIRTKGFAALYVNRNGYPDRGVGLQETLAKLGYTSVIESRAGDLLCVVLRPM